MGEVVLCWVLVEQAGHEHMSDEYKRPIYHYSIVEARILGQPDNMRSPPLVPIELAN